jgi:hypothetical protein
MAAPFEDQQNAREFEAESDVLIGLLLHYYPYLDDAISLGAWHQAKRALADLWLLHSNMDRCACPTTRGITSSLTSFLLIDNVLK